jgi:hypothetical protein
VRRPGDRKREAIRDGAGDLDGVANDGAEEMVETLSFEGVRRGAQHVVDLHEARDLRIQRPIRGVGSGELGAWSRQRPAHGCIRFHLLSH